MAIKSAPPEPDLPNIRKRLRTPRPLWRLFGWGSAAAIALAAVAITSQTEAGSQRLQLALAYVSEPVRAVARRLPPRAAETDAETQRLAAQVRELAADRERLTARIAMLERNLDDMTGSIKQQAAQAAAAPAATAAAGAERAGHYARGHCRRAAAGRGAASPDAARDAGPHRNRRVLARTRRSRKPRRPRPNRFRCRRSASPPRRRANPRPSRRASPNSASISAAPPASKCCACRWAAVKANFGPLLAGLAPARRAATARPAGIDYRLVVGPLPNAAAAAQLCARFAAARAACRPAKFDGDASGRALIVGAPASGIIRVFRKPPP